MDEEGHDAGSLGRGEGQPGAGPVEIGGDEEGMCEDGGDEEGTCEDGGLIRVRRNCSGLPMASRSQVHDPKRSVLRYFDVPPFFSETCMESCEPSVVPRTGAAMKVWRTSCGARSSMVFGEAMGNVNVEPRASDIREIGPSASSLALSELAGRFKGESEAWDGGGGGGGW